MASYLPEIPVVNELSEREFNTSYFQKNIPVVIKGAMKQSKAVLTWCPDHLISIVGGRRVRLAHSEKGVYNFQKGDATRLDMPFDEAVSYMQQNNCYYISQSSLKDNYPELVDDVPEPVWIDKSDLRKPTNLWFGGKGCTSPLHFDRSHNFLAQIYGRKHIILYAPQDRAYLYPSGGNLSEMDMDKPEEYPLFSQARPYPIELEPGDVLYLPIHWWHIVRSLDISISVNFWWERFELIDGTGLESVGVEDIKKMVRNFTAAGLDVDHRNLEGDTNLFRACERGQVNVVRAFLELGADPRIESQTSRGQTALTIAREKGYEEIERLLAEAIGFLV